MRSFDEVKFQGQIWGQMRTTNLVGDLHKESGNKGFSNIGIVLFGSKFSTSSWQSKSVHDTGQLLSDIISTKILFYRGHEIRVCFKGSSGWTTDRGGRGLDVIVSSPHQRTIVDEIFITPLW